MHSCETINGKTNSYFLEGIGLGLAGRLGGLDGGGLDGRDGLL
jgi:hypothetical protein